MLIIPPLLINNKLISNFEGKAYYFNDFLASQCTPLNNNSKIPETQYYVTNSKLTVKFESKDISTIIRPSDVNKAHRIKTFPLCCINQSMFPDIGEKSNICLIPEFIPSSYVYHCFCL